MLNAMTKLAWKMFATPSAKHRNIQSTPVLAIESVYAVLSVSSQVRSALNNEGWLNTAVSALRLGHWRIALGRRSTAYNFSHCCEEKRRIQRLVMEAH
jgi:hypothetical protein